MTVGSKVKTLSALRTSLVTHTAQKDITAVSNAYGMKIALLIVNIARGIRNVCNAR